MTSTKNAKLKAGKFSYHVELINEFIPTNSLREARNLFVNLAARANIDNCGIWLNTRGGQNDPDNVDISTAS